MEWQKDILELHWGYSGTAQVIVSPDCDGRLQTRPRLDLVLEHGRSGDRSWICPITRARHELLDTNKELSGTIIDLKFADRDTLSVG